MDRNKFRVGSIFLVILITLNLSFIKFVQAQDELVPIIDKLNSLEKDMRDVQRKMNTKNISIEPSSNITTEQTILIPKDIAEHEIRIIELEDQLRRTNGLIEELAFKINLLTKQTEELKSEINKKMLLLSKITESLKNNYTISLNEENKITQKKSNIDFAEESKESKKLSKNPNNSTVEVLAKIDPQGVDQIIKKNTPEQEQSIGNEINLNIAKPQEVYQRAYSLLSKGEYAAAETAFKSFIKKFPKNPLSSNAYYWLGETFYVRQNYQLAAYNFANGYKNFPKGAKAPDQLLKLGISLYSLKKKAKACATFTKLSQEFAELPTRITKRAKNFSEKLECSISVE